MDLNQFTHRSQEMLQQAQHLALTNGHQAIEPGHLLAVLLSPKKKHSQTNL